MQYDTHHINELLSLREQGVAIDTAYLNEFARFMYRQYVHIRNSVNPKKCKNMYIPTVRERLQEAETLAFTCQLTRLDENQVHYVINFAEEHISAIK